MAKTVGLIFPAELVKKSKSAESKKAGAEKAPADEDKKDKPDETTDAPKSE